MRRTVALALLAGLTLVLAGGASSAPPQLAVLLARHVPILVLHPAERFAPVRVDGFLADSDLQRKTAAGWETIAGPLPAGGADLRLDQRSCRAIDGLAASPCYAAAEEAHGSEPVVHGKAFRTKTRIELQYWIWYPYDDWRPTVQPAAGAVWQVHEGDWESVCVVLDLQGRPLAAGYSQHRKGKRREWARVPQRGGRALVYVALGSHANFFAAGIQPFDPRTVDPAAISVLKAYGVVPADVTGRGRTIRPRLVRVGAEAPSWMTFAGRWGETEYFKLPDREPLTAGAGPTGPAFHPQWRFPVKETLSWPRG